MSTLPTWRLFSRTHPSLNVGKPSLTTNVRHPHAPHAGGDLPCEESGRGAPAVHLQRVCPGCPFSSALHVQGEPNAIRAGRGGFQELHRAPAVQLHFGDDEALCAADTYRKESQQRQLWPRWTLGARAGAGAGTGAAAGGAGRGAGRGARGGAGGVWSLTFPGAKFSLSSRCSTSCEVG